MPSFVVSYKVYAEYATVVTAENEEEARQLADYNFEDSNFGDLEYLDLFDVEINNLKNDSNL